MAFLTKFYSDAVGWCHFNWLDGHFAEDEHDAGIPDANVPSVPLLGGDSYDPSGLYLQVKTPYSRSFRGRMIHTSKAALETQFDHICSAYGSRGRLWSHNFTYGYKWVPARMTSMPVTLNHAGIYAYGSNTGRYALDIQIEYTIYQGLWNGRYHGQALVLPGANELEVLGSDLVLGYNPALDIVDLSTVGSTITNGGNREQRYVVMHVEAGSTIPTLTVTNETTGHAWTYSGGLVDGDVLVVDTKGFSVTKNGNPAFWNGSFVQQFSWVGDTWFGLAPGANVIAPSLETPGSTIAFSFHDAFAN